MSDRPVIPLRLERAVKIEAGHRCAIPTCRHPKVEMAHAKVLNASHRPQILYENSS